MDKHPSVYVIPTPGEKFSELLTIFWMSLFLLLAKNQEGLASGFTLKWVRVRNKETAVNQNKHDFPDVSEYFPQTATSIFHSKSCWPHNQFQILTSDTLCQYRDDQRTFFSSLFVVSSEREVLVSHQGDFAPCAISSTTHFYTKKQHISEPSACFF